MSGCLFRWNETEETKTAESNRRVHVNAQQLSAPAHRQQLLKCSRVWSFAYTGRGGAYSRGFRLCFLHHGDEDAELTRAALRIPSCFSINFKPHLLPAVFYFFFETVGLWGPSLFRHFEFDLCELWTESSQE